jgi:hypothetical protein
MLRLSRGAWVFHQPNRVGPSPLLRNAEASVEGTATEARACQCDRSGEPGAGSGNTGPSHLPPKIHPLRQKK